MYTMKKIAIADTDLNRFNMSDLVKSVYEKQKSISIIKRIMADSTLDKVNIEAKKREIKELETQIFIFKTELRKRYSKF